MAKKHTSKNKGNRFERSIAKELSKWMFDDDTILFRDSTSGGRKVAYSGGDIVPVKQMTKLDQFSFHIEVKHGYSGSNIATFYNQKLLRDWLIKAESELTTNQYILMLIVKHNFKQTYVIFNRNLSILPWSLAININNKSYYSYMYKDLLSSDIDSFFKDLKIEVNDES